MGVDETGPARTLLVRESADVDSQPLAISVLPSDRTQRIKELIEPLLNIPVALQRLKSGGRILKDAQRVSDYSVLKPGAIVWVHQVSVPLVRCPTPGCNCEMKPSRIEAHLLRCPALAEKHALLECGYCSPAINAGGADELEAADPDELEVSSLPFDEREFCARVLRAHAAAGAIAICEGAIAACEDEVAATRTRSLPARRRAEPSLSQPRPGGAAAVPTAVSPPTAEAAAAEVATSAEAGDAERAAALGAGSRGHGEPWSGEERAGAAPGAAGGDRRARRGDAACSNPNPKAKANLTLTLTLTLTLILSLT